MSYKSEFTEVYNYLSDLCKDPIFTTLEASEDDFLWKDKDSSTGVIIKYNGSAKVVKIPNGVVEIGSRNDYDIYDPDGEFGCFEVCSVTDVILPKSLKIIGRYAFYECENLSNINIPDSVTSIGYSAFYECKSLTSIIISDSVKSIGDRAFKFCANLTSIIISDSVTEIGETAFSHCYCLESINIPNSVTSIGEEVFKDSGLMSITCSKDLDLSKAKVPKYCEVIRR